MSVPTNALDNLNKLNEIGFAEFTANLIKEVFNAIISANMNQTQAYLDLVSQLSKDLATYIRENKGSIGGADILNFLVKYAPDVQDPSGTLIRSNNSGNLTQEQANTLNAALIVEPISVNVNVANITTAISGQYNTIVDATAVKLSANKYDVLQEMVKDGFLNLVVDNGEILTSLNFDVRESNFYEQQSSKYNSNEFTLGVEATSGEALAQWASVSAGTKFTRIGVSTVNLNNNTTSSTDVKIAGSVKLNFSTKYRTFPTLPDPTVPDPTTIPDPTVPDPDPTTIPDPTVPEPDPTTIPG